MDSILFVTAYRDIDRKNWANYNRTTDDYLCYFFRLADIIQYPMMVFLEEPLLEKLAEYKFSSWIVFERLDKVATFYAEFLEKDREIMASKISKDKIPDCRKKHPEHLYSEYNLINHSKPCFISAAKTRYPDYTFYSWIDFGFVRDIANIPRNLNLCDIPKNKIIYQSICELIPSQRPDADAMLASYDIYLTGSSFIVGSSLVEQFEEMYKAKIREMQERNITDDDQSFILQIYYDHPELFCVYYHPEWCKLYCLIT